MRGAIVVMLSLVLLLGSGGTSAGGVLPDITNWGGDFLLSLIQSKINGKVTAKELSGNPISGVVFKDLAITDPDGKVILAVDRLEARLSLASIPSFRLDLGTWPWKTPGFTCSGAHPASGMSADSSKRKKNLPNPPNPKV